MQSFRLSQATGARRAHRRKLTRPHSPLEVDRLKAGLSQDQAVGRLRSEGQAVTISYETIYAMPTAAKARTVELAHHVTDRRRQRRSRFAGGTTSLISCYTRNPELSGLGQGTVFADCEGDLVTFRREHGLANVAFLVLSDECEPVFDTRPPLSVRQREGRATQRERRHGSACRCCGSGDGAPLESWTCPGKVESTN